MHFGLFLWSLCCFFLGVAFAGALYHYHIHQLINKANKLLEQLKKPEPPSTL